MEQAPQGSGHRTKPVRVQGTSGQHSEPYGLLLGSPARSRKMDLVILIIPFQLETFYDSGFISK